MKRYRVSIYTSVEVSATDEEAAIEEARDEVLSGLPIRECEFSPEEIEPPIIFYRAPSLGDQGDEMEAQRTPDLNVGWEYGFVFLDGAEIWGTVTALVDDLCTVKPSLQSGDLVVPLSFGLRDLKVVYCFGMPEELDDHEISWPHE